MSKKLEWEITVDEELHKVALEYSMLTGKAIVNIDGDEFDISTGLFKLRGTSQAFRLGEEMALLDFPKKGVPEIYVDGIGVNSGKRQGE